MFFFVDFEQEIVIWVTTKIYFFKANKINTKKDKDTRTTSKAIYLIKRTHYENNHWTVRWIVFNKDYENEKLLETKV